MFDNVRRHSRKVAEIAEALAERAVSLGYAASPETARAAGLLHDLAKSWCLRRGGSHAMLGASWTVMRTKNYAVAQAVMLHVHWPWTLPRNEKILSLPFLVIYADKRVRHDACVTLEERFEDLLVRYGKTERSRAGIRASHKQAILIEQGLSNLLELDLSEYTIDSGRLVKRT